MYIAVVQFNPKVGALRENCERALEKIDELAALPYPPDLVVFPAFALSGAELGGMIMHNAFAAEALDVAQMFMEKASLPTLIGTVLPRPAMAHSRFVCEEEVLFAMGGKGSALGFLDVTGEDEYSDYIESIQIKLGGINLAVVLDDYIDLESQYNDADVIIAMVARSYQDNNGLLTASTQIDGLRADALSNNSWVVVASLCGGEDCFVYEGGSIVIAPDGTIIESAPTFDEAVFTVNLSWPVDTETNSEEKKATFSKKNLFDERASAAFSEARKRDKKKIRPLLPHEADWHALCCGIRDYVNKNGFEKVVLGLSGGFDSAMVATLAADALGASNVTGILMPSPYTSEQSTRDATELATNLGINTLTFPIENTLEAFLAQAETVRVSEGTSIPQQNLQARIRMMILMYFSNDENWLLLNTGNRSEVAAGYSTLYGDTAGAIAPIGGFYKTELYEMAHWRNTRSKVIPQSILEKAPSAELYEGQKDTDSLPPYEILDQILRLHIDENKGVDEILEYIGSYPIKTDISAETILEVFKRVRMSEFKRRQEPMAFQFRGVNMNEHRSWPLTNGFEDHSRGILAQTEIFNYLHKMYRESDINGYDFLDN